MLSELRLRDFRPFEECRIVPGPGRNFLVGPNARGKTSLLEAACLLLRLQSPRTASPGECVRFGSEAFGLDGCWGGRHLRMKFAGRLKRFSLDSKDQTAAADYLSVARVAWIANTDIELVRGSPGARRRFLDFLGAQIVPGYLRSLRAYDRALRSRNVLLRDGRPAREVRAFDFPLAEAGDVLIEARERIVEDLLPFVGGCFREIAGGGERPGLRYLGGGARPLHEALAGAWSEDCRLRSTTRGPHRDDLEIVLDGRPAETFASEGQQRSLALALKFGQAAHLHAVCGRHPLYLIDDIFGELDPVRRNNLLSAVPAAAQALITATTLAWAGEFPAHRSPVGDSGIELVTTGDWV